MAIFGAKKADACLCLNYKVIHGLVAVTLPDYIHYSNRISILKPSSNWSLFQLIISDQTLNKIETIFCLYMCILMGKRLTVFLNSFLFFTSKFFGLKMQKTTFFEKKGFESSSYEIDI